MKKTLKNKDVYVLPQEAALQVLVEEDAEVWVEDKIGSTEARSLKVTLKPRARLRWMSAYSQADTKHFHLGEGARLEYFHQVFGSCSDEIKVFLEGAEASVLSHVLFFGRGKEAQKLRATHVHLGRNTRSQMISRGAVRDTAFGHFVGTIQMEPGCSGADGTLEEHNLLLSKGSRIEAIPALEIRHDDVQASHSATLERVDDEKLFYLQSRGLSEQESLELLVEGFFWDALEKSPDLAFSDHLFKQILICLSK